MNDWTIYNMLCVNNKHNIIQNNLINDLILTL